MGQEGCGHPSAAVGWGEEMEGGSCPCPSSEALEGIFPAPLTQALSVPHLFALFVHFWTHFPSLCKLEPASVHHLCKNPSLPCCCWASGGGGGCSKPGKSWMRSFGRDSVPGLPHSSLSMLGPGSGQAPCQGGRAGLASSPGTFRSRTTDYPADSFGDH